MPTQTSAQFNSVRHLITAMQWEAAQVRLATHPDEAFTVTPPLNETALSTACRMKAPPALIRTLMEANPDAATRKLVTGRAPLHLSCSDLRRTARGVGFEDDALVVRAILSARPDAARIADDDGWLPLHCACAAAGSGAAPLSMVRDLISAYPASPLVQNKGGVTPLSMLWDRCALNEEDGRCILSVDAARLHGRAAEMERIAAERAYNRVGDVRPLGDSAGVWSKVLLMARASYHGTLLLGGDEEEEEEGGSEGGGGGRTTEAAFRPLHALAGIDCPPSMIDFAIRVHGSEAEALSGADARGNLPLHVAACRTGRITSPDGPHCRRSQPSCDDDERYEFDSNRGAAIVSLLRAYPRAARVQNRAGRVPLNLAIESGASWDCGGVRALFECAPEALEARDVETGLYPFMLAGTAGNAEVAYLLLRCNPGLVAGGLALE